MNLDPEISRRRRATWSATAWRCTAALAVLVACSGPQPKTAHGSDCFDFARFSYADRPAAESAFDRCFPQGSDVSALLPDLSGRHDAKLNVVRVPEDAPASLRGGILTEARLTKRSLDGLTNHWIVRLVTDDQARLKASEIELLFGERNYSVRKSPFFFENFTRRNVGPALANLLRYKSLYEWRARVTAERIDRMMRDAGARMAKSIETERGSRRLYVYEKSGRFGIMNLFRTAPVERWVFEWEFDHDGNYLSREVRLPGG